MFDYKQLVLTTTRISSTFLESIGNPQNGFGTGFWVLYNGAPILITNRHMVDLKHYYPLQYPNHELKKLSVWLWTKERNTTMDFPSEFVADLNTTKIIKHDTADVAIICGFSYIINGKEPEIKTIDANTQLATQQFFLEKLNPSDRCSFTGYPSNIGGNSFWDEETGLPIVRGAEISSYPPQDFVHSSIKSSHARLVTGLSFGGSSGSPIANLGTQISTNGPLVITGAVEPRVIGIMAGHWWSDNGAPDFIKKHTGLSYFVASTAIFELLEKVT